MKILYVTNSSPWPPSSGGALRDYHFISHLSTRHDVRVVVLDQRPVPAPAGLPARVEFRPFAPPIRPAYPSKWRMRWTAAREALDLAPQIARAHSGDDLRGTFRTLAGDTDGYELVWISRAHTARHAFKAGLGPRVVVDFVDVEWAAQRSHQAGIPFGPYRYLAALDTFKLARFERRIAAKAWRCVVCKDEDRALLGAASDRAHVVPNGTAIHAACPPVATAPGRLLFVGLMSYGPNRDAANWFVRDIFPEIVVPDIAPEIDIVGRDATAEITAFQRPGSRVSVHGFVADLRNMYEAASVVVCPIRTGSGTRLKVLEALSYGKAVVATTEAARGIRLRPGIDFLAADSASDFAKACTRLLGDPDLRASLGRSGRASVLSRYSWERVYADLDRVLTP